MSLRSTLTPLPSRHPESHSTPPAHHVGSPPTSFINPWPSYRHATLGQTFKARFLSSAKNFVPVPENLSIPQVCTPDFGKDQNGLKATWFGHASFLIETTKAEGAERGMRILCDPVWSQRVGPYNKVGPTRFTKTPCAVHDLPEIDAVLISHDHYDHLDSPTLSALQQKQNGNLRYFIGLNSRHVLVNLGIGIKDEQVTELDWWDGVTLSQEGVGAVDLICSPAQHRSGRAPWNFEHALWCSWIICEASASASTSTQEGKRVFFAGDTAYCCVSSDDQAGHQDAPHPPCPAFAEIGQLYGPFDLALLPIGCFKPRSLLSSMHSSPEDSISIHKDVRSKRSIGMHYGTYRGGISSQYEPVTEPAERWKKAAEAEGLVWGKHGDVGICDIGETVVLQT